MADPWFNPVLFGAWYGVIMGGGGGTLCGVVGAMAGRFAAAGRRRGLVLNLMLALIVVGAAQLVFAAVALAGGQPYAIWFPPLLAGGVITLVTAPLRVVVRRQYDLAEQRRIDSAAMRG